MVLIKRDVILKSCWRCCGRPEPVDGWYDVLHKTDRRPIQTFVPGAIARRVCQRQKAACQAAEILAEWDFERGYGLNRPKR